LSPKDGALVEGDETIWEPGPMATLTRTGEMRAFKHDGFWRPMDMLRDKMFLEEQWKSGQAKWKNW
jgi:glucose-1-phosphate cytidylyltransferase